ncbi:MAG: nuclear transport factor 2 family protein [Solirubrobacteraceae bacterium]
MNESPIDALLDAIDKLDADAATALMAPDCRLLAVDGRRAVGADAVREFLTNYFSALRSTKHRITAQWHPAGVWIAEVEADYELQDFLRVSALPRVFVLRVGPDGITDFRVYGAHERQITEHRTGEEGMWVGNRWIPPL